LFYRRACPRRLQLSVFFLLPLISCSNDTPPTDGGPPPAGEIGSGCVEAAECKSGYCLDDPSFPGAYCSQECSDEAPCPDGSTCAEYGGYKLCFDGCGGDPDCREGYVCDYATCRPPCTRDEFCTAPDSCMQGRCKGACQTDEDCKSPTRCRGGKCIPPCKTDEDCVPGNVCNPQTGDCSPKPGIPMGQACTPADECATAYCLPTRRICSVKCTASAKCPSGYVCGLEKVDKEKNGTFESVEADCVPVKGKGVAGAPCTKDDDCASSHCYDGLCMEACTVDSECSAGQQCVSVNILLDGGIPKFKGCVLRQGATTYVLGTFPVDGKPHGFDIPPNASSFVLVTDVASTTEIGAVGQFLDPAGKALYSNPQTACDEYTQPIRSFAMEQIASIYVPNTPSVKLTPGVYTYYLSSSAGLTGPITVRLQLKLGVAQKGTLNINWFFLNLAGTCIPGGTLNAASAPTHSWMNKVRNNMLTILKSAGLSIGKETFANLNNPALDVIDETLTGISPEVQQLFSSTKGIQGNAVNIFLVRKIQAQGTGGGEVLGMAGGIPGPLGLHGYVHSGLMVSADTACYEQYGYNPGHTVAHEIGHYLGLFHSQERDKTPGLGDNNQIICPCPCSGNMSCQYEWTLAWCRGEDPIPDTTTSDKNLMFWAAESTQMFDGNQLTAGQIRVLLDSPLVGH
jgi:hypothetical protein